MALSQSPLHSGPPHEQERGPSCARGPTQPPTGAILFCFQKLAGERDSLQRELEELRKRSEGLRARNKVLASEAKTLRSQMGTLVEKGRHDDELIDALMVRPSMRVGNWAQPQGALACPQMSPA